MWCIDLQNKMPIFGRTGQEIISIYDFGGLRHLKIQNSKFSWRIESTKDTGLLFLCGSHGLEPSNNTFVWLGLYSPRHPDTGILYCPALGPFHSWTTPAGPLEATRFSTSAYIMLLSVSSTATHDSHWWYGLYLALYRRISTGLAIEILPLSAYKHTQQSYSSIGHN